MELKRSERLVQSLSLLGVSENALVLRENVREKLSPPLKSDKISKIGFFEHFYSLKIIFCNKNVFFSKKLCYIYFCECVRGEL